jgi:hypothetical protein
MTTIAPRFISVDAGLKIIHSLERRPTVVNLTSLAAMALFTQGILLIPMISTLARAILIGVGAIFIRAAKNYMNQSYTEQVRNYYKAIYANWNLIVVAKEIIPQGQSPQKVFTCEELKERLLNHLKFYRNGSPSDIKALYHFTIPHIETVFAGRRDQQIEQLITLSNHFKQITSYDGTDDPLNRLLLMPNRKSFATKISKLAIDILEGRAVDLINLPTLA